MQTLKKKIMEKQIEQTHKKNCLDSLEWGPRQESLNIFCVLDILFVVFDFVAGEKNGLFRKRETLYVLFS